MIKLNHLEKREIIISIASGLIIAFLIFNYLSSIMNSNKLVEVLIASQFLTNNKIVMTDDFKVVSMKNKLVPPSAILKKEDVIGKTLIYPLLKNEILTNKYIINEDKPTQLNKIIPKGLYGFLLPSIWVNGSVSNIKINDYISILSIDQSINASLSKNNRVHFVEYDGDKLESVFLTLPLKEILAIFLMKEKGIPMSIVNNSAINGSDVLK